MSAEATAAEQACLAVMGRIVRDPQLAYMIGPGSESYRLLTDAVGAIRGDGGDAYRALIEPHLQTERSVPRSMYDAMERAHDALLDEARP